MMIF
ncbi:hypothetical protein [Plasmodium yoelii yoelii]|jgi:hypothetical protein